MTSCKSPKPSNKPQPPAQGPDALKCREYNVLSVEKHLPSSKQKFSPSVMKSDNVCWLATARISSSIEIGPAQVLAIKAGLAIPWNKLRLVRRYDIIMQCTKGNSLILRSLKSSGFIWLVRTGCVASPATLWGIISKERESCSLYISTSFRWR